MRHVLIRIHHATTALLLAVVVLAVSWTPRSLALSIEPKSPRHRQRPTGAAASQDENDRLAVSAQLGYLPLNFVKVSARTAGGEPVAIQTYPLNGGAKRRLAKAKGELTPFPSLYWLCSPEICRAVADLERRGFVKVLRDRLESDAEYSERFAMCHESYAKERWESLTDEDRDLLEEAACISAKESNGREMVSKGMADMIRYSGVAGTDLRLNEELGSYYVPSVKCLHAHYAHFRSGGVCNIVGEWTDNLLRREFPSLLL